MKRYNGKKIELNNDGRMHEIINIQAANIKELNRKIFVGARYQRDGLSGIITKVTGRWVISED